jgi:DNA gyrase/topoisomerase IV subunit A
MSAESQDREWQLRARMELLAAVICATDWRRDVMDLVAASADAEAARGVVSARFGLSREAATALLDAQIRRFAVREQCHLRDEFNQLQAELADTTAIKN